MLSAVQMSNAEEYTNLNSNILNESTCDYSKECFQEVEIEKDILLENKMGNAASENRSLEVVNKNDDNTDEHTDMTGKNCVENCNETIINGVVIQSTSNENASKQNTVLINNDSFKNKESSEIISDSFNDKNITSLENKNVTCPLNSISQQSSFSSDESHNGTPDNCHKNTEGISITEDLLQKLVDNTESNDLHNISDVQEHLDMTHYDSCNEDLKLYANNTASFEDESVYFTPQRNNDEEDVDFLGMLQNLSSEIENGLKLCNESEDLEDFLSKVEESNLDSNFCKEKDIVISPDSDANLSTDIKATNSATISEASHQLNEELINSNLENSIEMNQTLVNSLECNEVEDLAKRGDGDGSSLPSEIDKQSNASPEPSELSITSKNVSESLHNTSESNNCLCERSSVRNFSDNRSALISAWNELRSSIRQLHRSVIPSSSSKLGSFNAQSRPSINRIKALTNMLLAHDPYQLFSRVQQLSQEFCIELKVRLLATIHDSPNVEEALRFINGLCEAYELVAKVSETIQSAFEKLDSEYLSQFHLSWMTINFHTFYATIFTDPDVQEYLNMCSEKIEGDQELTGGLDCLTPLKKALEVAESIWNKAENLIQEYAVERAAINAQRRQFLSEWEQLKSKHNVNGRISPLKSHAQHLVCVAKESVDIVKNVGVSHPNCSCTIDHSQNCELSSSPSAPSSVLSDASKTTSKSCECHFCSSSNSKAADGSVLSSANRSVLPPLSQPQLSLYPHIHGSSAKNDITSNQALEDLGPLPPQITTKPHILENPYLGSDFLTEQLIREWDLAYGDTLSPPGMPSVSTPTSSGSTENSCSGLSNQMKSLYVNPCSHPPVNPNSPSLSTSHHDANNPASLNSHSGLQPHIPINKSSTNCNLPSKNICQKAHISSHGMEGSTSGISDANEHTKNCIASVPSSNACLNQDSKRSSIDDGSWSSADETDDLSSDLGSDHDENHCDCCYCHNLQSKPGGGRQRYQDRRDRLLKILSEKKRSHDCGTVPKEEAETKECAKVNAIHPPAVKKSKESQANKPSRQSGRQSIDDILNYIEGKRIDSKCPKKAAKKARQKQRKLALEKQAEERRNADDSYTDDDERENSSEFEEEEEEDGPLAELRRRAPDVTITVVKPGQQKTSQSPQMRIKQNQQINQMGRNQYPLSESNAPERHPLATHSYDSWNAPRPVLPSGQFSSMPMTTAMSKSSLAPNTNPGTPAPVGGLSSLLKGMENLSKDQSADKDGKNSQMVTIRRVMDPVSSEPTVTITLKGEEPKNDKVLFKLVNGQACPGDQAKGKNNAAISKQKAKPKSVPQVKPVYIIPEGVTPEEAKKIKKQQKKERQRQRDLQIILAEEEKEKMKIVEIEKQKEFLKQQEAGIRKQQEALERKQKELIRQQQSKNKNVKGNNGSKAQNTKANSNKKSSKSNDKGKKVSALVYEGDDVARNFTLPPGVSINKVAGQPGMVTISNNMGSHFPQPFLPNPNIYPGNSSGYSMGTPPAKPSFPGASCESIGYPGMYNDCGMNMPWSNRADPCSKTHQESVIVVDTNTKTQTSSQKSKKKDTKKPQVKSKPKNKNNEKQKPPLKSFDDMTSEEKIEAAVQGELDLSLLNVTQTKKYKKRLKAIREEHEEKLQEQREEDELMDRMYEISRGLVPLSTSHPTENANKSGNKKNSKKESENRKKGSVQKNQENKNYKGKQLQGVNSKSDKPLNKKQTQNNSTVNNTQSSKNKGNSNPTSKKVNDKTDTKLQNNKQKQNPNPNPKSQITQKSQQKQQTKHTNQPKSQQQNQKPQTKSQTSGNAQKSNNQSRLNSSNNKQGQTFSKETIESLSKQNHHHQNIQKQYINSNHYKQNSMTNANFASMRGQPSFKGNLVGDRKRSYEVNSYGKTVGYANNDYGHEARYAQYLAANASTLASMDYDTSGTSQKIGNHEANNSSKNVRKKGKRGHLEDLHIDSVFTPKELPSGELDDETDREVEAFKRFCLYNVPRSNGEKPKVNFNVKDLMIKKKH